MDIFDVVHGVADSVKQSGAASDGVIPVGHLGHLRDREPVVENHALVVEEYGGNERLSFILLLLSEHGVEAADGVALKSAHGPAAVEDKNDLSNIVFHDKYLRFE